MSRLQANTLLLLAALIWGSTFAVQQVAMDTIGPMGFTATRFLLGGMVLLPLAWLEWRRRRATGTAVTGAAPGLRDWGLMIAVGAVLFTGTILQQIGIIHTTVTNAGFLTVLYVILVPLLGLLLLRHVPHWSVWPAGLLCLGGTFILSGAYRGLAISAGDWWVISSSFFWAGHVLLVGLVGRRLGAPILFACVQFLACSAIAWSWTLATEELTLAMIHASAWSIVYAGVVSVGIGFTLQVVAQRHTPASDVAILLSMETVFAALGGAFFLGERLAPLEYAGCGLILFAVMSVELLPMMRARWSRARIG